MIDVSPPLVLGFLVRFLAPWQVVVLGVVVTVIALNLRFEWLLTLAVLVLALAEFHYQPEVQISYMVRQLARLIRWFLFLAIALKGLALALRGGGTTYPPHPIRALVLAILALAFFTMLYSYDGHVTAASALLLGLVFFCAFGVLWRIIDGTDRVVGVAHALYLAFWPLIVASMALYPLEVRDAGFLTHRYAGIFLNPNGLGVLSAVFFPLALWELFRAETKPKQVIRFLIVVCTFAAVFASGSRSALVGLGISGTIFLFHRYGVAFPVFVATVVVLLVGYMVAGGAFDLVDEALTIGEDSEVVLLQRGLNPENRFEKWAIAWDYISREPDKLLLGYGYGTARLVPLGIKYGSGIWQRGAGVTGMDFHTSHLQTWMEMGIPGLILVEVLLISILVAGLRFFRGRKREDLPVVGVALFASLVVMIGDTVVHGWLFSPGSGLSFIFWCYTALVVRATQFLDAEEKSEEPLPSVTPLGGTARS